MKKITAKEREVALDWANGKITQSEAARKLKKSFLGAYVTLARALREVVLTWS